MRSSLLQVISPVRVLIADPNAMARGLISEGLKKQSHFEVVGSVGSGEKLFVLVEQGLPDVALVSANLEARPFDEQGVLRRLQNAHPKLRVIVLIDHHENDLVVQAFHNGARGVMDRSASDFKALCKSVSCVHNGQIWIGGQHLELLVDALRQMPQLRVADSEGLNLLTRREEDVVRLVTECMSNRQISERLNLSEHTVKNYLFRIFDKLGISSRMELALYAMSSAKEKSQPTGKTATPSEPPYRPGPASAGAKAFLHPRTLVATKRLKAARVPL